VPADWCVRHLLRHPPRGCGTIRHHPLVARTDTDLYALDREPFLLALTGHTGTHTTAESIVDQRLEALAAPTTVAPGQPPGQAEPLADAHTEPSRENPGAAPTAP
jgi:hypothetical protein